MGFWEFGPASTLAIFETSSQFRALLAGGGLNFSWSNALCGSNPAQCDLSIRRNTTVAVTARLTSQSTGALVYEATATARYLTQ